MYQIIATDDFVSVVKDLPLAHLNVLTQSFISIKKIDDAQIEGNKFTFLNDLFEQIRNQELE